MEGKLLTNSDDRDQGSTIDENEMNHIEEYIVSSIREIDELKSALKKEKELSKEIKIKIFLNYIELLDAFKRIFKNVEEKKKEKELDKQTKIWIGNFRSIMNRVERILRESGVSVIETPDGKAVPGLHTVIETREVEGLSDDAILEEIESGYMWVEGIIRKSSVIVVKNSKF